jgi:hypothetical protein
MVTEPPRARSNAATLYTAPEVERGWAEEEEVGGIEEVGRAVTGREGATDQEELEKAM